MKIQSSFAHLHADGKSDEVFFHSINISRAFLYKSYRRGGLVLSHKMNNLIISWKKTQDVSVQLTSDGRHWFELTALFRAEIFTVAAKPKVLVHTLSVSW